MSKVLIFTDKPFYLAGDLVTGKVAIHLDRKPEAGPFELELSCTGFAETSFTYTKVVGTQTYVTTSGNPPVARVHSRPITKEFMAKALRSAFYFHGEQTLGSTDGQSGFLVPFEFRLPSGLPASFSLRPDEEDNPEAFAIVAYRLKCTLASADDDVLTFSEDFVVGQVPQPSQGQTSKPVSLLYCIPQGQVSCTIQLNKDYYLPGEGITLGLFLDSERLTASFDRIHVSLHQNLILRADGQTRQLTRTILKYKFDEIDDVRRQMILTLPEELECSTSGDLVESTYGVRVKFKRRFAKDIVFEAPMHIQMAADPMTGFQHYGLQPLNRLVLK
jgi:hypothetical protein